MNDAILNSFRIPNYFRELPSIYGLIFIYCIHFFRDHDFHMPRQKKSKRKVKFGKVSGPMVHSKGALSVRQYHKTDESKIL